MLEAGLEKFVCDRIKACGGKAYKWVSPGCVGVPDRIAFLPGGRVVLIEMKRPGLKDGRSARQKKEQARLTALGAMVWTINDKEDLRMRLRDLGYEV